jgi:hypothetical protein
MLSSFADMEGEFEYTQSDHPIQALTCFAPIFDKVSDLKMVKTNTILIYFSRIYTLISSLAEDEDMNFIIFNSAEGIFVVKDSTAKRLELQRMMKVMATERLKEQVQTLETKLGGFKHLELPCYILDPELFISNLAGIKQCLMQRQAIIITAQDGNHLLTSVFFSRSKQIRH